MGTTGQRTWGCKPRGGGKLFIEGKGGAHQGSHGSGGP
jgi:hypothetical protein